ncbi:MAG TPA: hypothetical protein VHT70_03535 [Candidatus Saccharimonadales bacterium]|jgi:hypothetical protein|nr:hypothetical protein [Candidatus Saccharimonadales bacterium]
MGMENGPDVPTDANGNVLPGSYNDVSWTKTDGNTTQSFNIGSLNAGGDNNEFIQGPTDTTDYGNVNFGHGNFNFGAGDAPQGYTSYTDGSGVETRNYGDLSGRTIQFGDGRVVVDGEELQPLPEDVDELGFLEGEG